MKGTKELKMKKKVLLIAGILLCLAAAAQANSDDIWKHKDVYE